MNTASEDLHIDSAAGGEVEQPRQPPPLQSKVGLNAREVSYERRKGLLHPLQRLLRKNPLTEFPPVVSGKGLT